MTLTWFLYPLLRVEYEQSIFNTVLVFLHTNVEQSPHEAIGDQLTEMGHSIEDEPLNHAYKLREGMEDIGIKCRNADHDDLIFQIYFLETIIDDIWKNMAIDVSYEIPRRSQQEILSMAGSYFKDIGNATKEKDFIKCYKLYVKFLNEYREKMSRLEERWQ